MLITGQLSLKLSLCMFLFCFLLQSHEEREWISNQLESRNFSTFFTPSDLRNIYTTLATSETFDHFMTVKFGSFKRYGLEGNEAMMCAAEKIFQHAASCGVEDIVIGMPHRELLGPKL